MKMLKKGIFVLLAMALCTITAFSQTKSITQKADDLFKRKKYIEAVESYEEAFKAVKSNRAEKNRILYQTAECYRYMNLYQKAIRYYKKLVTNKYYNTEPKIYLYLAEMYRFSVVDNNIEISDQYYTKYLELVPGDEYATERQKSLKLIAKMFRERTRHVIDSATHWNTAYNDWNLMFMGKDTNTFIFTSSRITDEEAKKDDWTGEAFSSIFYQTKDRKLNWMEMQLFDGDEHFVNTDANEGEASATADGGILFFSRCTVREHVDNNCQVYMTVRTKPVEEKGKKKSKKKNEETEKTPEWSTPTLVDLGDTTYSHMHPTISPDGLTLYYVSDRPDGYGDFDIWMAKRSSVNDKFGESVNLGPNVNTPGKEVFPTLNQDSILYFSSNGWFGIGGLDLFRCTPQGDNNWSKAENLGVPINSSFDEFSIIYYPNTGADYNEHGFFTSNRYLADPHSKDTEFKGKKLPLLQYDIFSFYLPPLVYSIEGTVRDEKSMQLIRGAKVRIVGSDGTEYEETTDKAGYYHFGTDKIKRNIIYKMYVSKVDYFSVEGSESTCGYNTDKALVHNFRLEPVPKQPVTLPEIHYDLAKWDLKEQYQDSLMDLYLTMVNNPNLVIEIRSHTDCRPYLTLTNDTLSQRRAQSVVDYLISRGIESDRLVAKGYAERVPRELEKDITINGYTFKKGMVLECDFIRRLPQAQQNIAHQLNRRTDFMILRTDYVSKKLINNMASDEPIAKETEDGKVIDLVNKPMEETETDPAIVHDENTIPVTMIQSTKGEITSIINGSAVTTLVDEHYKEAIAISWEEAMNFLYQRRINKEDFPERDNSFDPEGNILDKSILILKNVQIGQKRLTNVEVVVVKNAPAKFIINRVGLNEFGKYSFDKQHAKITFIDE